MICMDILPSDSNTVISGSEDGTVFLSSLAAGKPLGELAGGHGDGDAVEVAGFCPHLPNVAATGDVQGRLSLWDIGVGQPRSVCQHPEGKAVVRLRWHPQQPLAITACVDGRVRAWDVRTGACVREWQGHTEPLLDLALSPDGSACITASDDCTARVFRL